jgi:hypothetical protein
MIHFMTDKMSVRCSRCYDWVLATVKGEVVYDVPREGLPERYRLVQCGPKGHAILVLQENLGFGLSFHEDKPYQLYPPKRRIRSPDVPGPLREEHEQALRCFEAKAYAAAVVMVGRTLEGLCADRGSGSVGFSDR